ncbi:uncharacterized protein LOC106154666 isoform X2 [Lingula anatina]|uniref:Uncharacterized protein LOC106154666 isoform X2 n=1 Tax=Lingula anatina TaxID=7574 RepID=A0A1S3HGD2_LINAN|nr:uncharacterized protein LOC106154666 isoform X2 [Lingula anatina]|eukprot:XP_013384541.1 uncharacterized protein LOC106154666 isoform X2 [Lingula anatina]
MKEWCLYVLLCAAPYSTKGLTVTLSGVNPNGYLMNQAAAAPSAELVCSYDLGSDTQPAEYVTFYKDGADTAHQIAVVKVADGASAKQNSYQGRSDVEVNANDPQYTLRIASLQYSDEGNYTCKVVLNFQQNTVTSSPQNLIVFGLEVTLAGLPVNGYVMNPEGGNPQPLNIVCSYTVDQGETAQYVTFFKDGTDTANQIVVIQVFDGTPRKLNSYTTRADVTASGSDPSFTLTIGGVTMADEGSYRCRVSLTFNAAVVTTDEQILSLLYWPNPPQITRGPQVATEIYRVSCSSDGGRPAPEIKWFKMQSSDQMEVAINATANTVRPQGDTFLVESEVEVMATQADPVEVICQLLYDSLTSQTKTSITVPESAAPSTTTTTKSTNVAGLVVTLADLPSYGLVMNPDSGIPPTVNLVCSYTVDPGETMQVVYFYKNGTTASNQIVGIVISDGSYQLQNSFASRTDVMVTVSDPSFTVTIGTVTSADEGSYYCKVSTILNNPMAISSAQKLKLVYRPFPPQITRGPQVATDTYRVTCSSDGGRPAPEIKWFKIQTSDQMQVPINATSNTVTLQGDTFLVESAVEVMATQADPVELICQLLHDSLISQITTKTTVPESAAPSTYSTAKSTNALGNAWRTVSIVLIVLAMCLFCIIAYLVFRIRSLSRRLESQASEQQHATVITNNVTEHSNNISSPFYQVSTQRSTYHSSGFDGVNMDFDDTALANSYQELRRDNRLDGQYMESIAVQSPKCYW